MSHPTRRPRSHPIHTSPFDTLPPSDHYQPSITVSRPRAEAGALAGGRNETPAVLPGVFRQRTPNLDSDQGSHIASCQHNSKLIPTDCDQDDGNDDDNDDDHGDDDDDDTRSLQVASSKSPQRRRSPLTPSAWRRFVAPRASGVFVIARAADAVVGDVRLIVEQDLRAEVLQTRPGGIRLRVMLADVVCTAVVGVERGKGGESRVTVRRSFADCFRVRGEVFDEFCEDLERRLVLLRAV